MLIEATLWAAGAPFFTAALALLSTRPWRASSTARSVGWAAPAAIGVSYAAAHLKLTGGPGLGIEGGLLLVALLGFGWGILEAAAEVPPWARALGALAMSTAAGGILIWPLVAPQEWSAAQVALRVLVHVAATAAVWLGLHQHLKVSRGPASALALAVFAAGSAVVVVFGGLAVAGQLQGAVAAVLAATFLVSWRSRNARLLSAAAAPIALLFVAHWSAAVLYGSLPAMSLGLLVLGPLSLLTLQLEPLTRVRRAGRLALTLALVLVPLGAAAAPAARAYFGIQPSTSTGQSGSPSPGSAAGAGQQAPGDDDDDDYGY